jgi:hypothetical protein
MQSHARPLRYAVPALALALTAACSSVSVPVTVTGAPTPAGPAAASCQALLAALPGSLGKGLDRRGITPGGAFAAAWGAGPVLLTCGQTGTAPGYTQTSHVEEDLGVDWYLDKAGTAARWSTPTRLPQVILVIPAGVDPEPVVGGVTPAICAHTSAQTPPLPGPDGKPLPCGS